MLIRNVLLTHLAMKADCCYAVGQKVVNSLCHLFIVMKSGPASNTRLLLISCFWVMLKKGWKFYALHAIVMMDGSAILLMNMNVAIGMQELYQVTVICRH